MDIVFYVGIGIASLDIAAGLFGLIGTVAVSVIYIKTEIALCMRHTARKLIEIFLCIAKKGLGWHFPICVLDHGHFDPRGYCWHLDLLACSSIRY